MATKRKSTLVKLLERARRGDAESQFLFAERYYDGDGVEPSYKKALGWCALAAKQSDSEAQYFLGRSYQDGDGVAKNKRMAMFWFQRAAGGHAEALKALAQ